MEPQQLQALLQQSEGYNLEFKEGYAKDIASEMCAFANAAGGTLLIGVKDGGQVKGVHFDNQKASQLQQTLSQINPPLPVQIGTVEHDDKTVVAITCSSGNPKPYIVGGSIFVRIEPNSQKLTSAEEMRDFSRNQTASILTRQGALFSGILRILTVRRLTDF